MSDERILSQLDNDRNVIGYQPDLEYKKNRTATGKYIGEEKEKQYDPEKDTTLYTKTLNGFAENTPSSVLKDIEYVLKNVNRLKQNLAKRFKEEQAALSNPIYDSEIPSRLSDTEIILNNSRPGEGYNPYNDISKLIDAGNTGNTDFTKQFEDKYDNVYGSVIPSLINKLSKIEQKLSNLSTNFKKIYYNDPNILVPDAQEIDNSYVGNMRTKERDGKKSGINYLTVSFDSILNKIVSYTVFQDNKSAIKVAKVIDSHEKVQATSNDMDIIKKMFDDIEKSLEIRSRGYQRNDDLELIQKSLYNYYEKRKYLNDTYNLYKNNPESKFLSRKVAEYSKNLTDSIKNVARVLMYNQNYLNNITELEKQKYNLQKISRSTSSNS